MRRTFYAPLIMLSLLCYLHQVSYAQAVIYKDRVFDGSNFSGITLGSGQSGSRFINCTFRNITRRSGSIIKIEGAKDILIEGCTFENIKASSSSDVHAITCPSKGSEVMVRNCKFSYIAADGIQLGNKGEDIRNWSIENNTFYKCRENGIDVKKVQGNILIRHNTFSETIGCPDGTIGCTGGDGTGIVVHKGANDVAIDGNRFYKNYTGITITHGSTSEPPTHILVINNVFYEHQRGGMLINKVKSLRIFNNTFINDGGDEFNLKTYLVSGQVAEIKNNLFIDSPSSERSKTNSAYPSSGNLFISGVSNAGFKNPGQHDYHLSGGSPAIDAGVSISAVVTDMDGNQRGNGQAYDVGAHEFVRLSINFP